MGVITGTLMLSTVIQAAVLAASVAYQITQSKKMRKKARDAAEARKGFELVLEGDIMPVPIVYGRALVGGVRVYHNVTSSYVFPASTNYDRLFDVGPAAEASHTIDKTEQVPGTGGDLGPPEFTTSQVTVPGHPGGFLGLSQNGSKNEFLFFQQVLCHGPIHAVHEFVVDEKTFSDEPSLGSGNLGNYQNPNVTAAFRTEIHYDGGVANNVVSANFSERGDAKFPGLAYANTIIKLNRDEPQFQSVPTVQYFVEGRKVRAVDRTGTAPNYAYALASTRIYSNNPALCLLDYLLECDDRTYNNGTSTVLLYDPGKRITVDEVDLASFYDASAVCAGQVLADKPTAGKIWRNTDGSRNELTRDIPLYECNMVVDTTKPMRENVESILSSMGDARLVWSEGRYKLSLKYPQATAPWDQADYAPFVNATITDDDLVLGSTINLNWPTSSERLNHCIVRFHNEAENFKEDTISWPHKVTQTYVKGIGGTNYPVVKDTWADDNDGARLLTKYGVWSTYSDTSPTLVWLFRPTVTATHSGVFTADDYGTLEVERVSDSAQMAYVDRSGNNDWGTPSSFTCNLVAGIEYRITITGSNATERRGVAARLYRGNITDWSTRSTTFDAFETVAQSSAVYDAMLAEDNGVPLETTLFLDGCTDYYHALAKAEEMVRTSRSAVGVTFKYLARDKFLEPGDLIKLESQTLSTSDLFYVRVNEVKLEETGVCEVVGSRFEFGQLAWNVADDEYRKADNLYDFDIPPPTGLAFEAVSEFNESSSGRLYWRAADFDSIAGYIVYLFKGDLDVDGYPVFAEIGRTTDTQFYLPALKLYYASLGVRTYSKSNRKSKMAVLEDVALVSRSAMTVRVTSDYPSFVYAGGNFTPTQITMTAVSTNVPDPKFVWRNLENDQVLLVEDGTAVVGQPLQKSSDYTVMPFADPGATSFGVFVYDKTAYEAGARDRLCWDEITLFRLDTGTAGISVSLNRETLPVRATSDGTVYSGQLPYAITATAYRGAELLAFDPLDPMLGDVYYEIIPTDCTIAPNAGTEGSLTPYGTGKSNGEFDVTGFDTGKDMGTVQVWAKFPGTTVDVLKVVTVYKTKDGQPADLSPYLSLQAAVPVFIVRQNNGGIEPTEIAITALTENITDPDYSWQVKDIGGTYAPVTPPDPLHPEIYVLASFSEGGKVVKCTVEGLDTNDTTVTISDEATIYAIKEGSDAINGVLSNEFQLIRCQSDGTPLDYLGIPIVGDTTVNSDFIVTVGLVLMPDSEVPPRFTCVFSLIPRTGTDWDEDLTVDINETTGDILVSGINAATWPENKISFKAIVYRGDSILLADKIGEITRTLTLQKVISYTEGTSTIVRLVSKYLVFVQKDEEVQD